MASHQARLVLLVAWTVTVLVCPSPSHAQASDTFVQGLTQLIDAADGAYGDEGAALVTAIETMTRGLAEWDARIANVEARLGAEVTSAARPVAARMRTALGTALLQRGRFDEALTQFAAAADLDPSFADVHVLRALAYERITRGEEAASAYEAAWARDPQNAAHAYQAFRSQHAPSQSASRNAVLKALSAALDRRLESGEGTMRGFLTADLLNDASVPVPLFPRASYGEGFDLFHQGRYDQALAALRNAAMGDALVRDQALQSDEARRGAAALRREDVSASIVSLEAAARRNPESAEVHRLLGLAYWNGRQYKESLAQLRTTVGLSPQDERARLALADVLSASGDVAAARDALRETIRNVPGSSEAYWKLARLAQAAGDGIDAVRSLEQLTTMPVVAGRGHLYAALGQLHHAQFNLDAAAAAYERRVRLTPNDADAHFDLGEVYRAQDRLDDALAEYVVAALIDPASAKTLAMIGQTRAAAGQDEEAVQMLRRAVTLDPAQLAARYGLSRALLRLGKTEDAQRELRRFEQDQQAAMEGERRRFLENQRKIDEALKAGEGKGLLP